MKTNVTEETKGKSQDIIQTLVVLSRGNFIVECSRELGELTEAIINTNKPGDLTIKLKVTPSGWKEGTGRPNQVDVKPEISINKPRHDQGKSIFFVTDENLLTRDDPDQEELFKER